MKITKAHLVATAKDINALIQPEDNPFKPTAKTTSAEVEEWIKEAVTVLEPEDKEVLNSATKEVLTEMGLTDWMGTDEEPEPEPVKDEKKKSKKKVTPKTKRPAAPNPGKQPKEKVEKKKTRIEVMQQILTSETPKTKEQLVLEMKTIYGGSESAATEEVRYMVRILEAFQKIKYEGNKISLL